MSLEPVIAYLSSLQDHLCASLEQVDGTAPFHEDLWHHTTGGGGATRVLCEGALFEQAGINFSHVHGPCLPEVATAHRPEFIGSPFEATGLSLVIHPQNPYIPTCHLNLRYFTVRHHWWFGGGLDLTPYYPFKEDVLHWHRTAQAACEPFGKEVYPRYKAWCDQYFFLKHRNEHRGVGGLFFDNLNQWDFATCFAFLQAVGNHFLPAYLPIVARRKTLPYGEREREFQLYRRGRYVEFNLVQDRGTLFGLQTGGRVESILMSLPPAVKWHYNWQPEPGSPEAELATFLLPQTWVE